MFLSLLDEVFKILDLFDSFSLWHVYRECNLEVDMLSKVGVQMDFGQWMIT
jgi:hypothetical protein